MKCYNCGKLGHFAKDFHKRIVNNSHYYEAKLAFAMQKEAGEVMFIENNYWLGRCDDESDLESDDAFMGYK